MGNFFYQ